MPVIPEWQIVFGAGDYQRIRGSVETVFDTLHNQIPNCFILYNFASHQWVVFVGEKIVAYAESRWIPILALAC